MLKIDNLHVEVGGHEVLKGVNLQIAEGENFILFGPNGSGKTTLLLAIMGFAGYRITQGSIVFKGVDITNAPMYERARLGIGMSFQRPPTINGLSTKRLVAMCGGERMVNVDELAGQVKFSNMLDRDVNAGFSGGEIKRSELLQLMAQQPDLLLFDEPESGVDLESMALIGHTVRRLLDGQYDDQPDEKPVKPARRRSGLIITHTGYILEYIKADRGQVLYEGSLCCEAGPRQILDHVARHGYQECVNCFGNTPDSLGRGLLNVR